MIDPLRKLRTEMLTCYRNRGGLGNLVVEGFAIGTGADMRYAEDQTGPGPGYPVVWGLLRNSDRVIAWAREARQFWWYIDHAYFGRGHGRNYRITRNAFQAGPMRECPDDRAMALGITLLPWRRGGSFVLVCPPTDAFAVAHGCTAWLRDTLAHLKRVTDRPVLIRHKPALGTCEASLAAAVQGAHALVTHSSIAAVEAVVLGVPVFVDPASAAAPVGKTNLDEIESPAYPDRRAWLSHLAYSQFGMAEIRSGEAWRLLMEFERLPYCPDGRSTPYVTSQNPAARPQPGPSIDSNSKDDPTRRP